MMLHLLTAMSMARPLKMNMVHPLEIINVHLLKMSIEKASALNVFSLIADAFSLMFSCTGG